MRQLATATLIAAHLALLANDAFGQTYVRVRDDLTVPALGSYVPGDTGVPGPRGYDPCCAPPPGFDFAALAWYSQSVPGGGTLSTTAYANPALINDLGQIVFMATIDGPERNQGIFVADDSGLTPIAIGCGGGGGSGDPGSGVGDPSPIGGTFSGLFGGTVYAPVINNAGDVLFMADVDGGSAPRGLFLYQADTGQIISIAAIGDSSPVGGTIVAVGPGSMNNHSVIVFLAQQSGAGNVNILKWDDGVVTSHVAVGDAVPGGGSFRLMAGEAMGYSDGSWIPIGDVPGINDAGQVSFFATTTGATFERGMFVTTDGTHEVYVRRNEETPMGGNYLDFQAPLINEVGQIAFFADVRIGGDITSGWFVGRPGEWRKALAFNDEIAGGEVYHQAYSRNPMTALDDCGSLLLWCRLRYPDGTRLSTTLLNHPDVGHIVVAQEGEPTPEGGEFAGMCAWPSMNSMRQGSLSAFTPGTPGGISNTYFAFTGRLPGDLDGDLDVDLADLAQMLANYGTTSGAEYHDGDLDGDGDVDLADLAALLAMYDTSCP